MVQFLLNYDKIKNIKQGKIEEIRVRIDNIKGIDTSLDTCFRSYNTLTTHKSLLDLELCKLDYSKYDEEFENFLLDLKILNDVNQVELPEDAEIMLFTRAEKRNIMSLFSYLLDSYKRLDSLDKKEIQEGIRLSELASSDQLDEEQDPELQSVIKLSIETNNLVKATEKR